MNSLKYTICGNPAKNFTAARFGRICRKWPHARPAGALAENWYIPSYCAVHCIRECPSFHQQNILVPLGTL